MTRPLWDDARLHRIARAALLAGLAGAALCVVGAIVDPAAFYRAWLKACLLWLGVSLGGMAIVMLHHLVGGTWGFIIRRPLEAAMRVLPLMALLFVPLLFGLRHLYFWAGADPHVAHELHHKQAYLNVPFFVARMAAYFLVWLILAWILNRWSREQDDAPHPAIMRRLQLFSGPGLVIYGVTMSFAAFDWVMSIQPHFYSTIFGLLFLTGQPLGAMAFAIIVVALLADRQPLSEIIAPTYLRDLGNLMLAFTMLWAYMSFSQWLIIWSGNLPEEAPWYIGRLRSGWAWIGLALIVLHFALPFVLLLSRLTKESLRRLSAVAVVVFVMRYIDLFWLVGPRIAHAHSPDAPSTNAAPGAVPHELETAGLAESLSWLDLVAPVAVGGLWVALFIRQLRRRPLVPLHDERFSETRAQPHGAVP